MIEILYLVVPFFAVIGCGYVGARLVGEGGQRGINNLVLYFALPALLFSMLARSDFARRFEPDFIFAYVSVSLSLFAVTFLLARAALGVRRREAAIYGMGSVYGNVGYMGLPIIVIMLGQSASVPAAVALVIDLALVVPLGVAVVESDSPGGERGIVHAAAMALGGAARNPLILAMAAGAAWSSLDLPMPEVLGGFLDLLGAAAAPCALFALGSSLYGKPLGGTVFPAVAVSALKLVAHPILLWFALTQVWHIDPSWARPAVIAASLPVAVTVYVVARQYATLVLTSSTAILVSTSLSLATVPLVLVLVEHLPGL